MSGMDQVLEIHGMRIAGPAISPADQFLTESDSDLVCQAGARWMDINEMLKDRGIPLFFPVGLRCSSHFGFPTHVPIA